MDVPVVWSGELKMGDTTTPANADAHYVWCDDANIESVKQDIGTFPDHERD